MSSNSLEAIDIINKKIGIRLNQKELIPFLLKDPEIGKDVESNKVFEMWDVDK